MYLLIVNKKLKNRFKMKKVLFVTVLALGALLTSCSPAASTETTTTGTDSTTVETTTVTTPSETVDTTTQH